MREHVHVTFSSRFVGRLHGAMGNRDAYIPVALILPIGILEFTSHIAPHHGGVDFHWIFTYYPDCHSTLV